MSKSIAKFCEICQVKVEEGIIVHLLNNDDKSKLLDLLPEIDLHLTPNSVICNQCCTQITDVQEFKQLQVKDEDKVLQHNVIKEVPVRDKTICVKEEPGAEKIKEEFNVSLVKDEVYDLQVVKDHNLLNIDTEKSTQMYYCRDCGCSTDNRQNLIQHICKQHRKKDLLRKPINKKIYQCDMCDYISGYKSRFKTHMLSKHAGEKPYQCDKCDYKTVYKSNMDRHKLLQHAGLKPYQCDKCSYKSSLRIYLKNHILSHHTDEKPYQCDKCDYKSAIKEALKNHRLSRHTNLKPYQCDKCKYKSSLRIYLKNHILSHHTDEKPYQCDKCDYKCARKNHFKRHTLSQHAGEKHKSVISATSKVNPQSKGT